VDELMETGPTEAEAALAIGPADDVFEAYTDRELLLYLARQLSRLEPLLDMLENPPPMFAGLMGARKAAKAAKKG
jgi:hypothetical protein